MPVKVGLKFIEKWNESMEDEVLAYEKEDMPKGQIVFYGPSNFTRWSAKRGNTPLREALPGASGQLCCINRGFGSSSTEHHLYYYSRMVRPLEPKVLVYAPGMGNSTSFGYTPEETLDLAKRMITYAQTDFPDLKVYICGLNLYKARLFGAKSLETQEMFDGWLREWAAETPNCTYLDSNAYEPLCRSDIFEDDKIHYNNEGYKIYAEFFKEVLKEELDQF